MLLWIAFAAAALFGLKPLNDNIPSAQTKSSGVAVQKLMPVGAAVGIHIQTNGLMVLGTAQITDSDGRTVIPAKDAVREGDYILAVDGRTVNTAGEMTEAIRQKGGSAMCLRVLRNGEVFEVEVSAVKTTDGSYKTGIWVRDDTQGIGTLSFIDEDNRFAALGHECGRIVSIQYLFDCQRKKSGTGRNGRKYFVRRAAEVCFGDA